MDRPAFMNRRRARSDSGILRPAASKAVPGFAIRAEEPRAFLTMRLPDLLDQNHLFVVE